MKKNNKYWVDINNNKWSVDIYNEEEAFRNSATMLDCSNCEDCDDA